MNDNEVLSMQLSHLEVIHMYVCSYCMYSIKHVYRYIATYVCTKLIGGKHLQYIRTYLKFNTYVHRVNCRIIS